MNPSSQRRKAEADRSRLWFVLAQPRESIAALCWETTRRPRTVLTGQGVGNQGRSVLAPVTVARASCVRVPKFNAISRVQVFWCGAFVCLDLSCESCAPCHRSHGGRGEPWSPPLPSSRSRAPRARAPQLSPPPAILRAPQALLALSMQALPLSPAPAVNKEPHPQADWRARLVVRVDRWFLRFCFRSFVASRHGFHRTKTNGTFGNFPYHATAKMLW